MDQGSQQRGCRIWAARIAVGAVFIVNIQCALRFLIFPESYQGAYELSGVPGKAAIQGIAVAFLMWNATYPLVVFDPVRFRTLFIIILIQQTIGLVGESLIFAGIGDGYPVLSSSILRFIAFDGIGLVLMASAFLWLFCGTGGSIGRENSPSARG